MNHAASNKLRICLQNRLVLSLLLFVFAQPLLVAQEKNFVIAKNLDIFSSVVKELDLFYVDTIDANKLVSTGIKAMLNQLDPYTTYYPEEEVKDLKLLTTGTYGGVGAIITPYKKRVAISEPYANMPAALAGLKAGDVLISIDGKTLTGKNNSEVSEMLRGEEGTTVTVVVEHWGTKQLQTYQIVRKSIQVPCLPYYSVLSDSVGYIMFDQFTEKSAEEVKSALVDLKRNHHITSLVFDLRNNGGGIIGEAINIVNLFVKKNTEVVSTKGKLKQWNQVYKTSKEPIDTIMPLVVLVNNGSASASEIVAGSIQDLDRGVIVGNRTYGKGLVQAPRELPYDTNIKITTSKYYIPSGRCIQAIDYKHRQEDGTLSKIPDSLTNVFKTSKGRLVRDGGGVTPDLVLKEETLPNILYYLISDNLVFEYANDFYLKNATIASPSQFVLTDQEYEEFKTLVIKNEFKYDRQSDRVLKSLKEIATFEGYADDSAEEFKALEAKLSHNLDRDLTKFKSDIKGSVESEIIKRYYYQKGAIEHALKTDDGLTEAVKVAKNEVEYKRLLTAPVK